MTSRIHSEGGIMHESIMTFLWFKPYKLKFKRTTGHFQADINQEQKKQISKE